MSLDPGQNPEWNRPENWHGGMLGIYHAPRDPRVWVPKRIPAMGWTLNFAHRRAWVWLLIILAIPLAFTLWVAARTDAR